MQWPVVKIWTVVSDPISESVSLAFIDPGLLDVCMGSFGHTGTSYVVTSYKNNVGVVSDTISESVSLAFTCGCLQVCSTHVAYMHWPVFLLC